MIKLRHLVWMMIAAAGLMLSVSHSYAQQPDVGEVRNIDALRFTNRLFRDFYSKLYIQLVQRAPTILGIVYNSTDEPWKTDRMRLMLDRLNTGPLERFIAILIEQHAGRRRQHPP